MAKSNGSSKELPESPPAITSLSISGFKSIVDEQTIAIRPLTLLAGVNSSGKSSMMQPLLLLKQTLEALYDPGVLMLNGPNVKFTSPGQFHPARPGNHDSTSFLVKVKTSSETEFAVGFRWTDQIKKLDLEFNEYTLNKSKILINHKISPKEFTEFVRPRIKADLLEKFRAQIRELSLLVRRDRFFFDVEYEGEKAEILFFPSFELLKLRQNLARLILDVIHLPGLRGNPLRTYPIMDTGPAFPGTFENYVASLIVHWNIELPEKIKELSDDLKLLGLTWKIEAKSIDYSQVELRVGRMPHPKRGGANDMVSIADVGLGISQTLPVVVALRAAKPGQLVYIEQPEIHLHPRAQVAMARLLVNAANRGVRVVGETHSSLLLLAVQTLIAEGVIDSKYVGLNWFLRSEKDGTTQIKAAELDEAGRFGDWPEDFGDVALEAENRYLSAAEARLAKE
jgi:AAA domain, putative AbiEii toxin, Type IV TA system